MKSLNRKLLKTNDFPKTLQSSSCIASNLSYLISKNAYFFGPTLIIGNDYEIHCEKNEIYNIKKKLEIKIKNFISTKIEWVPINLVIPKEDEKQNLYDFINSLEDDEDIQNVYTNLKFTDFKKLKGIQRKWKKIYLLMHRIQMKHESFLNQIIQSKNTNLKIKII